MTIIAWRSIVDVSLASFGASTQTQTSRQIRMLTCQKWKDYKEEAQEWGLSRLFME